MYESESHNSETKKEGPYIERDQPFGLISNSCNWVILHKSQSEHLVRN